MPLEWGHAVSWASKRGTKPVAGQLENRLLVEAV